MIKIGVDPGHIFDRSFSTRLVRVGSIIGDNVCGVWAAYEIKSAPV